jgi:formylglycine-generating enzyme required for sulfatase activity
MLLATEGLTQNQLQVNVFASSAFSEGSLSWFMDDSNKVSGSQLTIQVRDFYTGEFISGCDITVQVFNIINHELKVTIKKPEIEEVAKGLYALRGSRDPFFWIVLGHSGNVTFLINVNKPGYAPITTNAVFRNRDYIGGYDIPGENMWMSRPHPNLAEVVNDPGHVCESPWGKHYWVVVHYFDQNNKVDWLYVPVNMSDHKIPSDWTTYQATARALTLGTHYNSFRPEPMLEMDEGFARMQRQLRLMSFSGLAIDILVPLLNKLVVGAATGGKSLYYDAKKSLSMHAAEFLLSQASDPNTYSDAFFYEQTQRNLQQMRDSIGRMVLTLRSHEYRRRPFDVQTAERLYNQWKYVLVTTSVISDLVENGLLAKDVQQKMLEAQIKYLLGSQMPQQMKLVQLARFIETREQRMLSSFTASERTINALHDAYDRHWDDQGMAKQIHEQIGGKSIKKDLSYHLPAPDNFRCNRQGMYVSLEWDAPRDIHNVRYAIKYNSRPITDSNWHTSYYMMLPTHIPANGNTVRFRPGEVNEREKGLHYAIRYFDENGRASRISSTTCKTSDTSVADRDERDDKSEQKIKEAKPEDFFASQMVFVQGGCFWMGTQIPDYANAQPVHEVCLDGFYISNAPVTQQQWKRVMGNNPSQFVNCPDCPVENVSWNDIQLFLQKLNEQTGLSYRLPTEAEWEYAANGGQREANSGTAIVQMHRNIAWYEENSGGRTKPVRTRRPNSIGLYDMLGNVFEWCSDWYAADYYRVSPKHNPAGPHSGNQKVIRGGAWTSGHTYLHPYYRAAMPPGLKTNNCGFRLALDEL